MSALVMPKPGDLALTEHQPWGDLIISGAKDVENRGWQPPSTLPQWGRCEGCGVRVWPARWIDQDVDPGRFPFMWAGVECRGGCGGAFASDGPFPFRLWVHAGKHVDPHSAIEGWKALGRAWDVGPTGVHYRIDSEGRAGALLGSVEVAGCHHADECQRPVLGVPDSEVPPQVRQFCSRWAEPDAYHWQLADPRPLDTPIPMRGRQKLWTITADDLAAIA